MNDVVDAITKKLGDIDQMLFSLQREKFDQIVYVLEESRAQLKDPATVNALLQKLRPRLIKDSPSRRYTVQRLFCLPFEELLSDNRRGEKAMGKIPRKSIPAIWQFYEKHGQTAAITAAKEATTKGPLTLTQAIKVGTPIWADAAQVIRTKVAEAKRTPDSLKKMSAELGGQDSFLSAEEASLALAAGDILMLFREQLPPPPIRELDEKDAELVATTIAAISKDRGMDAASSPLMMLLARLESPTLIKTLMGKIRTAGNDTPDAAIISKQLDIFAGQASEAVVGEMESRLESLAEAQTDAIPREAIARRIEDAIAGLDDVAANASEEGTDKQLRRRFDKMKQIMKNTVTDKVIEGTSSAVGDALASFDPSGGLHRPSTEAMAAVEDRLVALRLANRYSDVLDLKSDLKREIERSVTQMKDALGTAVQEAMTSKGGDGSDGAPTRDDIESNLMSRVRMMELVGDAEGAGRELEKVMDVLDTHHPDLDDID